MIRIDTSFFHSAVARRIFFLFIICALLPVAALALISLRQVSTTIEAEKREQLRQACKNAGMTIAEVFSLFETELHSSARVLSAGARGEAAGAGATVDPADERRFLALTLVTNGGKRRALTGKPCPAPVLDDDRRRHLADGKALLFFDDAVDSRKLYMAVPINHGGVTAGLLVGQVNTGYLWTLVRHSLPSGTELCVVDSKGCILFNTSFSAPSFLPRIMTGTAVSSVGNFEWREKGKEALVNYWSVFLSPLYRINPWVVTASWSRESALEPVAVFGRTFIPVIIFAILIVVCLSSIQIRRNLVPLAKLREGARQLSDGNLAARVTVGSGDEFEQVAETFNGMADQLQRQFTVLAEMRRIAERVFSAEDQSQVAEAVLTAQETVFPSGIIALTLINADASKPTLSYLRKPKEKSTIVLTEKKGIFSGEDLALLKNNQKYLNCTEISQFAPLLVPLKDAGSQTFFLYPVIVREELRAVLTIGYESVPVRIEEEVTSARKLADETAAALEKLHLIEELNQLNIGTVKALANAVDAKSPWTAGHSERLTGVALAIGRRMGYSEEALELLYLGGMFHDIGKIAVPESILDKNGALTDQELALIRTHPAAGAKILEPIRAYSKIIPMVAQHHEHFNGKGYPLGIAGNAISLGARILAVADVYDALLSDRPYRRGWPKSRVLAYMTEQAGAQFDPVVVEAFLSLMAEERPVLSSDVPGQGIVEVVNS